MPSPCHFGMDAPYPIDYFWNVDDMLASNFKLVLFTEMELSNRIILFYMHSTLSL